MNSEIKAVVEKCSVCAEPMQSHQVPDRPWSKFSTVLFTVNVKNYITLVEYFSDFLEVDELEDTTSHAVIQVL